MCHKHKAAGTSCFDARVDYLRMTSLRNTVVRGSNRGRVVRGRATGREETRFRQADRQMGEGDLLVQLSRQEWGQSSERQSDRERAGRGTDRETRRVSMRGTGSGTHRDKQETDRWERQTGKDRESRDLWESVRENRE